MAERRSGIERRSGTDRRSNFRAAIALLYPPDLCQDLRTLLAELEGHLSPMDTSAVDDCSVPDVTILLWIERCRAVVDRARA